MLRQLRLPGPMPGRSPPVGDAGGRRPEVQSDGPLARCLPSLRQVTVGSRRQWVSTQLLEQYGESADLLGEDYAFRSRDPLEPEIPFVHSKEPQDLVGLFHHFLALFITSQVMAVADVSP